MTLPDNGSTFMTDFEPYLIGSDLKMRSHSRFFSEDPTGFLKAAVNQFKVSG
jgi:hypothetical protein